MAVLWQLGVAVHPGLLRERARKKSSWVEPATAEVCKNFHHARETPFIVVERSRFGVAACGRGGGGGGGGDDGPPSPYPPGAATLSLGIGLKQLRFTWGVVDGATSYRLLANPDGASGFTQVGDDFSAGERNFDVDVAVHLHDWTNARYMLDACNADGCTGSNELGTTGSMTTSKPSATSRIPTMRPATASRQSHCLPTARRSSSARRASAPPRQASTAIRLTTA